MTISRATFCESRKRGADEADHMTPLEPFGLSRQTGNAVNRRLVNSMVNTGKGVFGGFQKGMSRRQNKPMNGAEHNKITLRWTRFDYGSFAREG